MRSRFTEIYVDEIESTEDLSLIVQAYLQNCVTRPPVDNIVSTYLEARKQAASSLSGVLLRYFVLTLQDGANQRPNYSLRTLCRALQYTVGMTPHYGFQRAL